MVRLVVRIREGMVRRIGRNGWMGRKRKRDKEEEDWE